MDLSKDIAYTDIIPVKRKRTKNQRRDSSVEKYKTEETKDTLMSRPLIWISNYQ